MARQRFDYGFIDEDDCESKAPAIIIRPPAKTSPLANANLDGVHGLIRTSVPKSTKLTSTNWVKVPREFVSSIKRGPL